MCLFLARDHIENLINDWLQEPYQQMPYTPGKRPLSTNTLSLDAFHCHNIQEMDFHNLNGLMQQFITHESLDSIFPNKLPFVLSRSTWPGSGRYGATWTGDNAATWAFLKYSIAGIFNFNVYLILFSFNTSNYSFKLFGIP